MEVSIIEIWHSMTVAAKVVASVLLIMSVAMVAVSVERLVTFVMAKGQSKAFAATVGKMLKGHDLDGVKRTASDKKFKRAYLGRIVAAGVDDFRDLQETKGDTSDLSTIKSAMARSVEDETQSLRRWLAILATIGATAPFIGLLGTVLGIIGTFHKMAVEGTGLEVVGVNIAEALVITAFGLFVAIPAVWLYNYFNGRVEGFILEMNNNSSEMADYFLKNRGHLDNNAG